MTKFARCLCAGRMAEARGSASYGAYSGARFSGLLERLACAGRTHLQLAIESFRAEHPLVFLNLAAGFPDVRGDRRSVTRDEAGLAAFARHVARPGRCTVQIAPTTLAGRPYSIAYLSARESGRKTILKIALENRLIGLALRLERLHCIGTGRDGAAIVCIRNYLVYGRPQIGRVGLHLRCARRIVIGELRRFAAVVHGAAKGCGHDGGGLRFVGVVVGGARATLCEDRRRPNGERQRNQDMGTYTSHHFSTLRWLFRCCIGDPS